MASSVRNAKRSLRLPPLPSVRDLISLYGLRALRQLSQNFLLEPKLINKLVRVAGDIRGCEVCEVGPGPGGITRSILERDPSKVIVIEKDTRFQPMLEMLEDASDGKLSVIYGDVLTFNMGEIFSEKLRKDWNDQRPDIHLIGNLPFSISTPLIIRWMREIANRSNAWTYGRVPMTLTFQLEVAERICAPVSHRQRCRLSVMCQNWCRVNTSISISGRAFLPPPDVDVGVVKLAPLKTPTIQLPFDLIEKVVRQVFSQKQKHAWKGAGTLFPKKMRKDLAYRMFGEADLPPDTRPFLITVEEFGRLCESYKSICDATPELYNYNSRSRKSDVLFEDPPEEDDGEEDEEEETGNSQTGTVTVEGVRPRTLMVRRRKEEKHI